MECQTRKTRPVLISSTLLGLGVVAFVAWSFCVTRESGAERLLSEWRVLRFVGTLVLLVPLTRVWVRGAKLDDRSPMRVACVLGSGGLFVVIALGVTKLFNHFADPRLDVSSVAWSALAAVFIVVPAIALRLCARESDEKPAATPVVSSIAVMLCAALLSSIAVGRGAPQIVSASSVSGCRYALAEV